MTYPDSTPPDTPAPVPDGRDPLPQKTTPTWEMELLISGATVFSLLQLPDLLDQAFYSLYPRFGLSATAVVLLPYVYLVATTYALVITFVLHLTTRAYWVAVVGLHSVHPGGVDWGRLKLGPAYRSMLENWFPSPELTIERADNRASRVFGFGIGFALTLLAPMVGVVAMALVTFAIYEATGRAVDWMVLWVGLFVLLFGPFFALTMVDKKFGASMSPPRRAWLARSLASYFRLGFGAVTSYPMLLFSSRMGQARGTAVLSIAMTAVLGIVFVRMVSREDAWSFDAYEGLPAVRDTSGHNVDPRLYGDQRDGYFTLAPQPFIQSEVVEGDYLRLFVPYLPPRDAPRMEKLCPPPPAPVEGRTRAENGEAESLAVLACAARIYEVTLDGERLDGLQFDFSREASFGARGFVTRIDVRDLARGRHELGVKRAPLPLDPGDEPPDPDRPSQQPRRIPFWR